MKIRDLQKYVEEFIFVGQAIRLGVFDELARKPLDAPSLARRMRFDKRACGVLLEALAEMKYLKKKGNLFQLPGDIRRRLASPDDPLYEGDFWRFMLYLINPWRSLPHVMKSGKPDTKSYKGFSMEDFIRGMDSPWKKRITPEIVKICLSLRKGAKSVIDIGGAPGTVAREFARKGLRTVIYDLAISNRVMKRELSRLKNITVLDGDATKSLPGGGFDIAFLGNLCHGQSPNDNARIVRMCREILNERGMIVIFDNLRGEDSGAATLALHMLTQSPLGDVYTRKQYLSWLKAAGFKKCAVKKLSDPAWSLVVGYK